MLTAAVHSQAVATQIFFTFCQDFCSFLVLFRKLYEISRVIYQTFNYEDLSLLTAWKEIKSHCIRNTNVQQNKLAVINYNDIKTWVLFIRASCCSDSEWFVAVFSVEFLYILLISFPMFYLKKKWHCNKWHFMQDI